MKRVPNLKRASVLVAIALALYMTVASQAWAACTSPAGVDGQVGYDTTNHLLQYCNGTSWIVPGGPPGGATTQVQFNNSNAFSADSGFTYAGSGAVTITSGAAATKPLVLKGAASQTGNLVEFQSSSGTALAWVTAAGVITASNPNTAIQGTSTGAGSAAIQGTGGSIGVSGSATNYGVQGVGSASNATSIGGYFSSLGSSGTGLLAQASAVGVVPLKIQGVASQTADLSQWVNSSSAVLMVVNAAGNIGIGTSSATYTLDVNKSVASAFVGGVRNPSSTTPYGLFTQTGNDSAGFSLGVLNAAGSAWAHIFRGDGTAWLAQNGGYVGIGNTSPGVKLDVTGDIRSSGIISAPNQYVSTPHVNSASANLILDTGGNGYNVVLGGNVLTAYPNGNVTVAGTVTQNSDARLKTNIRPIAAALEQLAPIHGVTFNWKRKNQDPREQMGLIAQDVQKSFPQLVSADADGILSVNYNGMIGPLIEAVKELKADNDNLRREVEELRTAMGSK